jgi:diaminopimelate decarboxylase
MKGMGPIPRGFEAGPDGRLMVGGHDVEDLVAEAKSTPLFVYDSKLIGAKIARFRHCMPAGISLHYAVKANPYPPLLRWLCKYVDGFDVASVGELAALEKAGADVLQISFAGPGKSDQELRRAIRDGATIHLESEGEAARALNIAGELGKRPRLSVRVNPPFALKGAGMKMGGVPSPFGIDHDRVADVVRGLIDAGAEWRGLHLYAGSQCLDWTALAETFRQAIALAGEISEAAGARPPEINLGGGLGIPYFEGDEEVDLHSLGQALGEQLASAPDALGASKFIIELGRWLVGEAGVYLTRIVDRTESRGKTFLVTDGGLHHMLAASGNFGQLLRRNYPVAIASRFGEEAAEEASIVGCLCTPLDLLADEVALPAADVGDLVAVFCAGAYGLTASPQAFLSQSAARELML